MHDIMSGNNQMILSYLAVITSRQELHDEVQIERVLEGVVHFDDPLVVGFDENVAFGSHVGHL